ncbi:shikimate kinase [Tessaracoccus antarcticus]|uniref:Shikimate kinase n=1 Tax=Tessaracoccus antarcticus TaxID=2479848 RepID=A0A3M0G198_9ACTN|nr:shikimate kinase [Tessaracoccus antarcticus]RMB58740.1 shikimate kinase [Tessaracoccus antarcticus]
MSIVLIGAPGAGKSSVGRLLAAKLDTVFVDVDARIEEVVGKPIGEIFADDGEAHFRELEESATLELIEGDGVVSLGGGAVLNPRIRTALVGHDVVWLEVSISQATRRVGMNTVRPLLMGNVRGRLIELLRERTPLYEEVATTRVMTDNRRPSEVAAELAATRRAAS